MTTFFLFLTLLPFSAASGALELTLRSPWTQEVAVGVYQADQMFGLIKSLVLRPSEPSSVRFGINFNQTAKVVISVGGSPNYGLSASRFETLVTPIRGVLSPEQVPAPFDGLRVEFECDRDHYGEFCQQICKDDVARKYGKRCNSAGFPSCPHGFMGKECNEIIRHTDCPCQNGGQCATSFLSDSQEVPLCECPDAFHGPVCQAERDQKTLTIKTTYTPELRFVPQIVEKHYAALARKNELLPTTGKRVKIQMKRRRL